MQPGFISGRRRDGLFCLMGDVMHCIMIMKWAEWGTIGNVKRVVFKMAFPRSTQGC